MLPSPSLGSAYSGQNFGLPARCALPAPAPHFHLAQPLPARSRRAGRMAQLPGHANSPELSLPRCSPIPHAIISAAFVHRACLV